MEIRIGSPSDAEAIADLIASFQSELTDDPSGAGAEEYLASVSARAEHEYLTSSRYRYLLAFAGSQLAGLIAIRDGSHLFHLFVGRAHQRRGLARLLWEQALRELCAPNSGGAFTVNSSLSAVPVYQAFGFTPAGSTQRAHGISFVPMKRLCMQLVRPGAEHLASYVAALERGWSADNERGLEAAREELSRVHADAAAFLASMDDREATGPPITLPDGSAAKRLPGFRRWLWDGEFCGSIGLRWQPGTAALPSHCLGHIGYAVVPWKQRLGYAKSALGLILPEAKAVGLPYVEITTDPDNIASQRVIEANGGILVEYFIKPQQFGCKPGLRFRIMLS